MLSRVCLAAALFGATSLAAVSSTVSKVASSSATTALPSTFNEQCFTHYATIQPWFLATTEYDTALTQTATQFVYITPNATVTPPAITSTVSTTSTNTGTITAPTTTDVFTSTQTVTSTSTEIDTSSFTQTVTTVFTSTIASTTTIAPPVGFTGLAQWPGYQAKRDVLARREALQPRAQNGTFHLPTIAAAGALHARAKAATSGVQYPWNVQCTKTITYFATNTLTVTRPTSTTTLAIPTSWSTSTLSATATVTIIPADVTRFVTSTSMTSTTSTTVTSVTQTNTQINTVFAPSATFLAQCDPTSNMISSAVGQKIGTISYNKAFVLQSLYPKDQSGYGCCAQCALSQNCAGFAQAPASAGGAAGGACYYLLTDGRCDEQQNFGDEFHYYNTNANGYIVGNGQCGYLGATPGVPQ